MNQSSCESCGMPIESGRYCDYCTDAEGHLQDFETRFAAMVEWRQRRQPDAARAALEADTLALMATMPAWRTHPKVIGHA